MLEAVLIGLAVFPAGIVYASLAEWVIHRFLMHRPILRITHFYTGHALVHHGRYKSDSSYLVGDRERVEVTLAWWAMPFPVLSQTPFVAAIGIWVSAPAAVGLFVALTLYQASYEYFHYCMHVPSNRWFERTGAFMWINDHHLQHHRKFNTNLNIILPIADYLFGTRRRLAVLAPSEARVAS